MEDKQAYIVKGKKQETHDTVTLMLAHADGNVPTFVPGQFISVYFPELNTPEGKSYSISNPPGEETFNITVKGIGEFSNRLCAMELDDELTGSLPYGFFYSEQNSTDLVMIAAGIGITPFRSMMLHTLTSEPDRKMLLFQSARTVKDLIFNEELASLHDVSAHYFVTRDSHTSPGVTTRRICVDDILKSCRPEQSEFFICGSISFVRDLWCGLKERGVPEDKIYTEAFFSH